MGGKPAIRLRELANEYATPCAPRSAIGSSRWSSTGRPLGGDSILDAARRTGLKPPFGCQAGDCGTCMAYLAQGRVTMRVNNALNADEVEQGWILTCQAIPTSREVVVDYDR